MTPKPLSSARPRLAVAALMVLVAACGGGAAPGATTATSASPTTVPPSAGPSTIPTSSTATTSVPSTTATTSVPPTSVPPTSVPPTSTLPSGEPVDYGPAAGEVLGVIGVRYDDVLNLRSGPGVEHPILAELEPTEDAVTALGRTRSRPGSLWIEVAAAGTEGWVNLAYLAYLGDTTDATSDIVAGGPRPRAATMLDLGALVAASVAGESGAEWVVSVAPSVGDLGEVTYDVVGFEDDSVRGARLHVFGEPVEGGFVLKSVELTVLCSRGTSDGLCI